MKAEADILESIKAWEKLIRWARGDTNDHKIKERPAKSDHRTTQQR